MAGIEEKLERLAERVDKLEEKNYQLQQENQELKQRIDNRFSGQKSSEKDEKEISRRSFLRKLGAGAVGLGALSLAPAASRLTITDTGIEGSSGLDFLDSGSQYLKVNDGGLVEALNGFAVQGGAEPSSGAAISQTWNNSTGTIAAYDYDSAAYQTLRLQGNDVEILGRGGLIDLTGSVASSPANLRIATDQAVEDGSGNNRLYLGSAATFLNNQDGTAAIKAEAGNYIRIYADDTQPWIIRDTQGSFNAVQYTTSSSAPGTLELKNAKLQSNLTATEYQSNRGFSSIIVDGSDHGQISNGDTIRLTLDARLYNSVAVKVTVVGNDSSGSDGATIVLWGAQNRDGGFDGASKNNLLSAGHLSGTDVSFTAQTGDSFLLEWTNNTGNSMDEYAIHVEALTGDGNFTLTSTSVV